MKIIITIDDTEIQDKIKALQNNERETNERFTEWLNTTYEIDEYINQCLQKSSSLKSEDVDVVREESNVLNFKVYTDSDEMLYMM